MKYDAIVIGAGNGGLVAGLTLQKKGKNVLILEAQHVPGGFASSFVRGRFEFETSLHELCEFGDAESHGALYDLFERLGILNTLKMKKVPECYHIVTLDTKEEYTMPSGIQDFILKMEEYVPGSKESVETFFELAKEVHGALKYMRSANQKVDLEELKKNYPNFITVSSYSVEEVLRSLKMPKKAQEILSVYWTYLGSPTAYLSFVHFASMVYSYVKYGPWIPTMRSHEMSLVLQHEFQSSGGTIHFLSKVNKVLFDGERPCGVKLQDGTIYHTDYLIANLSPNVFYGSLIPEEKKTDRMRRLCNARVLGARGICVYLGLNRSADELGLQHYSYFVHHTLDSNKEFALMGDLYHDTLIGTVLNRANPTCSGHNTTILMLTSFYASEAFSKEVTEENYEPLKEAIAKKLIDSFERATNVNIKDAIEEIEIATPVTFARYGGHPEGTIFGYFAKGYDNLMPRLMNEANEHCFSNVSFCGGFASRLNGYSSAYLSGEAAGRKIFHEMNKEKREDHEDCDE